MFDPAIQPNVDIRREAHFFMTARISRPKAKIALFHWDLLKFFGGMGVILLCLSGFVNAQLLSNGVLNTANAADWTQAGVVGGIPSASWTQCGTTISAYTGTAATINSAIAACGSNQFVLLGAGTFTLSTGISFGGKSNVVLRGGGANTTFIVATSTASVSGCDNGGCFISIQSADSSYWNSNTSYSWTSGYTQGSTVLGASSTTGISTNTFVVINQCDDGYSGATCSGTSVDNAGYFNAGDQYNATGPTGASQSGPNSGNGSTHRFETELHRVCSVSAGVSVTLCEGTLYGNWNSARTPQIWFVTPIQNVGVENMSISTQGNSTALAQIQVFNAMNVWVKGVRGLWGDIATVSFEDVLHSTLQDSYFWETTAQDSHAIRHVNTSYMLTQNNICQQQIGCENAEGPDAGSVWAYNFAVENCNYLSPNQGSLGGCAGVNSGDGMQQAWRMHSNGQGFTLWEGNEGGMWDSDGNHGTSLSQTIFRNFLPGWETCSNASSCGTASFKDTITWPILQAGLQGRYTYVIGNVLGTPGYHNGAYSWTTTLDNHSIYALGIQIGGVTPSDAIVGTTSMRWANWDAVTNGVRTCGNASSTGWATTCGSASEVPTAAPTFPNSLPTLGDTVAGQSVMPPSFYLASKPSWFGSIPFPVLGPDVTGGNVQQCSGTLNVAGKVNGMPALTNPQCDNNGIATAWGGHVNANPAMACYFNTMGGTADGTGSSPLAFDASTCFASLPVVATPTFSPVAGTYATTQTVTISTTTGGATICWTNDGTTPTANGAGTCTHGTTYSGTISVSTTQTLKAIGSLSGDSDSGVGTAPYIIAGPVATPTFSPSGATYSSAQSVTISTSTGGATLCYTIDGTTPTANGSGTCTHGTTYSVAVSVAVSLTLKAVGSESGFTDSTVGSATYTIAPPPGPCSVCMAAVPKITPGSTTVAVDWATTVPATATVRYGPSTGYGRKIIEYSSYFYDHTFQLVKLKPATTYHLQLIGQDEIGNTITTPDEAFKTR